MKELTQKLYASLGLVVVLVACATGIASAQSGAANLYANNVRNQTLSPHEKSMMVPLSKVLEKIERVRHITFVYQSDLIEGTKVSQTVLTSANLAHKLGKLLAQNGLTYIKKAKGTYVIKRLPMFRGMRQPAAAAQITGTVTDRGTGETLPGVNIAVKGTTTGTATDTDGAYSLVVESLQDTLVFSYVGYQTEQVPINGRKVIDIALHSQAFQGKEMVVTALGIEKESKGITYSTQSVSGDEANLVKSENFVNSLAGKSAGLRITAGSGGPGSNPRVLLRGFNSITGSNQPLYVIDGIPGNIYDLNPEDIKNIQVLKGASAAALYGSRAANGVILVTTKKGPSNAESNINVTSTLLFSSPLSLPNLQTSYGQGYDGKSDASVNDSWGPKITDGSDSHLSEYFRTGVKSINSISISQGTKLGRIYGSYAYTSDEGIVPENSSKRNNFALNFSTNELLDDNLSVSASIMYDSETISNKPGYGGGAIFSLYTFPVGDDFSKYSGDNYKVWDPTRQMYTQNWPYIRNETRPDQNPYWNQNKMPNDDENDRTRITISGDYNLLDWFSIEARMSRDAGESDYEQRYYAGTQSTISGKNGRYWKSTGSSVQTYYDLIMRSTPKPLTENISLSGFVGFSNTQNHGSGLSVNGGRRPALLFPNYFSIDNLTGNFNRSEYLTETKSQALFGNITASLFDKLFIDISGRNEWSSTVDDSYFFPSGGLSYIFTEQSKSVLSYAKARVSYAEVGQDLSFGIANENKPYSIGSSGNIQPPGTYPFFSGTDTTSLKPERTRSIEGGFDLRFFNDRLSLALTYYDAMTKDQVFSIAAPSGSGAQNFWINGGKIRNQGIESVLSYNAMLNKLGWTSTINFSYNRNQIRQLSDLLDAQRYVLSGGRTVKMYLTRPEDGHYGSFGDMYGNRLKKDENGNILTDEEGLPIRNDEENTLLGNFNPDFLASINNRFNYENFSFSFLIDGRFGGGVASHTERWLDYKGLSKRSGEARKNGGVMVNGTLVNAQKYYYTLSNTGDGAIQKAYFYDATNIRLRELSIGYTLPIDNITLDISFVGRNLFFLYKEAPFDPEIARSSSGSSGGLNDFEMPSTRSYGLNIKLEI